MVDRSQLAATLVDAAARLDLVLVERGGELVGARDEIVAQWLLGDRRVRRSVRCELDDATRIVRWHEYFVERVRGIAPPTFTVQRTTISGTRLAGERRDASILGGGRVDYGVIRDAAEERVREAGWRFDVEMSP